MTRFEKLCLAIGLLAIMVCTVLSLKDRPGSAVASGIAGMFLGMFVWHKP